MVKICLKWRDRELTLACIKDGKCVHGAFNVHMVNYVERRNCIKTILRTITAKWPLDLYICARPLWASTAYIKNVKLQEMPVDDARGLCLN